MGVVRMAPLFGAVKRGKNKFKNKFAQKNKLPVDKAI